MSKTKNHLVYQFKITLYEIEPRIWRRIQVPAKYSFWDFHVAIQDAMGWLDYPKCLADKRACPPEDCGSVDGYYRVVKILQDPNHDEYKEHVEWLKGHAKNYHPYKTDEFNLDKVRFDNPKQRWKYAFSQD